MTRSSKRRQSRSQPAPRNKLVLELLEKRDLPSTLFHPTYIILHPSGSGIHANNSPTGTTPTQIKHAYGTDSISFNGTAGDGTGTTIAIVNAYDDPNLASDLQAFDAQWGLPNPTFTKVNQTGGSSLPAANASWGVEESLDVEWAHAIAPKASILLVEASIPTGTDLDTAVATAAKTSGVVVVSNSYGGGESSGETSTDSTFTTPSGHPGVTFVASSGDNGARPRIPPFRRTSWR